MACPGVRDRVLVATIFPFLRRLRRGSALRPVHRIGTTSSAGGVHPTRDPTGVDNPGAFTPGSTIRSGFGLFTSGVGSPPQSIVHSDPPSFELDRIDLHSPDHKIRSPRPTPLPLRGRIGRPGLHRPGPIRIQSAGSVTDKLRRGPANRTSGRPSAPVKPGNPGRPGNPTDRGRGRTTGTLVIPHRYTPPYSIPGPGIPDTRLHRTDRGPVYPGRPLYFHRPGHRPVPGVSRHRNTGSAVRSGFTFTGRQSTGFSNPCSHTPVRFRVPRGPIIRTDRFPVTTRTIYSSRFLPGPRGFSGRGYTRTPDPGPRARFR